MYSRYAAPGLLLALLTVVTACGPDAIGPQSDRLSTTENRTLALEFDATAGTFLDGLMASFVGAFGVSAGSADQHPPREHRVDFTVTRSCPAGGTVTLAGATVRTADPATRTFTMESNATKTHSDCARTIDDVTVTVNGNPNIVLTANRRMVAGAPSGLQTHTQKGSFTWTASDGRAGTCTVDLVSTFDPGTRTHTVKGVFCDREIDITRTRSGPGSG